MTVQDLLTRKSSKVITCGEAGSIREAAQRITENRVGALPVVGPEGALLGILSERDVARAAAERSGTLEGVTVAEFMTREVTVVAPEASVKDAMRTMGRLTIRHLPVTSGGKLLGVISQRDVLKAILDDTQLEVNVLRDVALARA
jgi:CBS domain-containing protein